MLTTKRLFFFTKGLGKSICLLLREVPVGVASVLTLGLAGEAVDKIMEFGEDGLHTHSKKRNNRNRNRKGKTKHGSYCWH